MDALQTLRRLHRSPDLPGQLTVGGEDFRCGLADHGGSGMHCDILRGMWWMAVLNVSTRRVAPDRPCRCWRWWPGSPTG